MRCGSLLALGAAAAIVMAQPRPGLTPRILLGPSDWRFESMPTPPAFAPDVAFTGFEEARFAPGMFDTSSPNYFTYVMVISADGLPDLGPAAIKDFLERYYRGLSSGLGRRKGLSIDLAQMTATVATTPSDRHRYVAHVILFDSFTDGRKITLNVEARAAPRPAANKTGLVFLISPQPKDNALWRTLREIGGKIEFGG